MRPIEFRAWDKKAEVMVYPVVVYETQDHVGFSEETFRRCYDQNEWYEHLEVGDDWYYLFDDKVMQYTGLQDANGHAIFEGDIVQYADNQDGMDISVVIFDEEDGRFTVDVNYDTSWLNLFMGNYRWHKLEVVGNIHQNKELLNKVKK